MAWETVSSLVAAWSCSASARAGADEGHSIVSSKKANQIGPSLKKFASEILENTAITQNASDILPKSVPPNSRLILLAATTRSRTTDSPSATNPPSTYVSKYPLCAEGRSALKAASTLYPNVDSQNE